MPGWAWRLAARLQLFHDPETLLGAATRRPGSTVALMLTPEDTENFAHHRGPDAVARLRRRGADLRVTDYPFGDHSLFGAQVRDAMLRDVLGLAEEAFPAPVPQPARARPRGMSGAPRLLQRTRGLGLFGLSVVLNGGVSLISIPVIVAVVGADPWASMATGQSIGASFGVLTIFGWGLTGPVTSRWRGRRADPRSSWTRFSRAACCSCRCSVIQAAVTFAIVPHEKLGRVPGRRRDDARGGLGELVLHRREPARPVPAARHRSTGHRHPRRSASPSRPPASCCSSPSRSSAGAIVALVVSASVIFRGSRLDIRAAAHWPTITRSLLEQRHGVVATAVFAAYIPAVLALIAVLVPALLPMFVLADRIGRFVAMAVSPLLQVFQGWVPAASGSELVRRIRISGWVALGDGARRRSRLHGVAALVQRTADPRTGRLRRRRRRSPSGST